MSAAGVATAVLAAQPISRAHASARVNYPSNLLANVADLAVNEPLEIAYPDDGSPGALLKLGQAVMSELGVIEGDLVEVYNDAGATQAMAYPTPTAKRGETFMLFAYPTGVQGNVVNADTNELILPNYKQTWGDTRKISDAPKSVRHLTFKSKEYRA